MHIHAYMYISRYIPPLLLPDRGRGRDTRAIECSAISLPAPDPPPAEREFVDYQTGLTTQSRSLIR